MLRAGIGRGALERQWGLEWAEQTLGMCNKIANFLCDSGPAKVMVQAAQVEVYGKKKQLTVNAPTRFATNFFVAQSILKNKAALILAVGAEAWSMPTGPGANPAGTGASIKAIIERAQSASEFLWENIELLCELYQPFSDAIHQLEADRPMLGQCYGVVMALHKHVSNFASKHAELRDGKVVLRLVETFQRRFNGVRAPIYNPAYAAAFMLDPYFAVKDARGDWFPPAIEAEQLPGVMALVQRVGGPLAERNLRKLMLTGFPADMSGFVEVVADHEEKENAVVAAVAATVGKKRKLAAMPTLSARMKIWEVYGKAHFSDLVPVALQLMACHATTCATERNWSLWGRVYTASRNALGIERAKKMIAICTNSREHGEDDFAVSLAVVDGDI